MSLGVAKGARNSFVSTDEAFQKYCVAVAIWTEGDSLHGQTKYLIKRKAFDKALGTQFINFVPCPIKLLEALLRLSLYCEKSCCKS